MSIEVMASRLSTALNMLDCKKAIKSAACILDVNYDADLYKLYRVCRKSGVSEEISQFVLLSKGMRDDLEVPEENILNNVKYAYPVLMLCSVYYELHDRMLKSKEDSLNIIEHEYVEIPITYVTVFKNIV